MFDFVPLELYTNIHYFALLLIVVLIVICSFTYDIKEERNIQFFNYFGYFVIFWYILYMGLRPISGKYFGDTYNYAKVFEFLQEGKEVSIEKDYFFNYFMAFCSNFMTINSFLLLLDVFYVVPYVIFSKKYFGKYWFFVTLFFISSFSFWASGVNGLRNGLGTSFFILGLAYYNRKFMMYILFVLSYFMHASLIIPIAAFLIARFYKDPKIYLFIWLASIPLSLAGGSVWNEFFANIGFQDRTEGYLINSEENLDQFSQTGFRWDFLIYSSLAVIAGWYFIFKEKMTDKFYIHLFGIYCIANAFWILVITAAFSNRFAYLSWFLMPVIIAYPILRYKIWKDQYRTFGLILLLYFMFTFVMNVK